MSAEPTSDSPADRPSSADRRQVAAAGDRPRVALFVTCLVDLFRPSVGFAAIRLLEAASCVVEVPEAQTCCGQPAFNTGDRKTTEAIARQILDAFEGYDYVVAPSGSCGGMLRKHLPELFDDDPATKARAAALALKCHELLSFLVDVRGFKTPFGDFKGTVAYHDSCSGLRELGVKRQPREMLLALAGVDLVEMREPEVCCGFGGTFCVKYPTVSTKMVDNKAKDIAASGADTLAAGDLGCLMNMAGRLKREGSSIKAYHTAEILAWNGRLAGIGEPGES